MSFVTKLRDMHIFMKEQELVPHTNHRNFLVGQFICNRTEQFVKFTITSAPLSLILDRINDIEGMNFGEIAILNRTDFNASGRLSLAAETKFTDSK